MTTISKPDLTDARFVERHFYVMLIDAVKYAFLASSEKEPNLERSYCRSGILSSIVMIECLANIMIENIPSASFRADLDKLPFLSKFDAYLMFKGKPPLDRGIKECQVISELKSIRDSFVHPKSRSHAIKQDDANADHFNIIQSKKDMTGISNSPASWGANDALKAATGAVNFARHVLVDLMGVSNAEAEELLSSRFVGDNISGSISQSELSEINSLSRKLKLDVGFLLPSHANEP